jgi:FtsZ-binding cell division protein ZapB
MSEDDLKLVLSTYQQKSFELFNQNVVLEAQINNLKKTIELLSLEIEKLRQEKVTKKTSKATEDF